MSVLQALLGRRDQAADGRKLSRVQWGLQSKRACFDDRRPTAKDHRGFDNQRISVHDQLGGKASVHDRLGGKASIHDQLGGRVYE
jgi:hypothetical protein